MTRIAGRTFRWQSWVPVGLIPRTALLCAILAIAFYSGNLLGHLHFNGIGEMRDTNGLQPVASGLSSAGVSQSGSRAKRSPVNSPQEAELSEWAVATVYSSVGRVNSNAAQPSSSLRLRLRSLSRISSGDARAGERITFVTEEAIEDASGQELPAGSRVEGVISQARGAGEASGRLVIEIHSLHVGDRSLALQALPIAALGRSFQKDQGKDFSAGSGDVARARKAPSGSMNPLNDVPEWSSDRAGKRNPEVLTIPVAAVPSKKIRGPETREAVVPQEAILEFELLTRPVSGQGVPPTVQEPRQESPAPAPAWRPGPRPKTARG